MQSLIEKYRIKLTETPTDYVRSIHEKIDWEDQLVAIAGARGVGKSTLLLQHIKLHDNIDKTLYVTADDLWFSDHSLYELANTFYKLGGRNLYIDEIHKYKNWSQEIKNIYDSFSRLKVCYTGSSILDLQRGSADLSRRLLQYDMYGLSFREYLALGHDIQIPSHSLDQILSQKVNFPLDRHRPLELFREYLKKGYYPYFKSSNYLLRLQNVVNRVIETDIPATTGITISTVVKLKRLLYIIAQSVPFKPNYSKIARDLDTSRGYVNDLMVWLDKAQLINILRDDTHGISALGKVDKVYLADPNLCYAISDSEPNIGNIRETIFLAWMKVTHSVTSSRESDFRVGKYTFEVGGKNKKHEQIRDIPDSFIVKDDIESGYGDVVPLWTFGLLY